MIASIHDTSHTQGYFSRNVRGKGQILELYELLCLCNFHTTGQNRPVQQPEPKRHDKSRSLHS